MKQNRSYNLKCIHSTTNAECKDALYCNGEETCQNGTCINDDPIDCGDGLWCDEIAESCLPLDQLFVPWYVFVNMWKV